MPTGYLIIGEGTTAWFVGQAKGIPFHKPNLAIMYSLAAQDLNKMTVADNSDRDAINFISRTSQNLGVIAKVKKIPNKEPFPSGLITVSLGGTYLLSSFVQLMPFYTAQNIVVLTPKKEMPFHEKIFYCMCIAKNRFKYTIHGREANKTLKNLKLPDEIPDFVNEKTVQRITDDIINTALESLDEM